MGDPPPSGSDEAVPAAAALLINFGMGPQDARDLVREHGPTADQVSIPIANAKAWQQAQREGRRKPLNNPVGFVRSQIEKKNYTLDPEAVSQRKKKQREAQRGEEQRQNQHRAEKLEQAFATLSPKQREQLKTQVLDDMRARNHRKALYYKKFRPQDEPLRTLIAIAALEGSGA